MIKYGSRTVAHDVKEWFVGKLETRDVINIMYSYNRHDGDPDFSFALSFSKSIPFHVGFSLFRRMVFIQILGEHYD